MPISSIKFKNTLTNKMDSLSPTEKSDLTWYSCGPTVYADSHLGHARNYIMNDIIRRIFLHMGFNVNLVMNITNIDDKIIKKANEEYGDPFKFSEISKKYEKSFFEDMDQLNVMRPTTITHVDEVMNEIIQFIQSLLNKNYAYVSNGSVYFHTENYLRDFPNEMNFDVSKKYDVANDESNNDANDENTTNYKKKVVCPHDKKQIADFALWKGVKENEPYWESPFGKGRPGWHIECSVMCSETLGNKLDIHSGGIDLQFPHHSNEIKQCVAYFGESWCNKFIHVGHLHIDNMKMAKSLGNFVTIKKILKLMTTNQIRFYFASYQYDKPMDYAFKFIEQSNNLFKKVEHFIRNIQAQIRKKMETNIFKTNVLKKYKKNIYKSLTTNFNTPKVIQTILELINETNIHIEEISWERLDQIRSFILEILNVLGIEFTKPDTSHDKYIDKFVQFRDQIRSHALLTQDMELLRLTDQVRSELLSELDVIVEDLGKKKASKWKWN